MLESNFTGLDPNLLDLTRTQQRGEGKHAAKPETPGAFSTAGGRSEPSLMNGTTRSMPVLLKVTLSPSGNTSLRQRCRTVVTYRISRAVRSPKIPSGRVVRKPSDRFLLGGSRKREKRSRDGKLSMKTRLATIRHHTIPGWGAKHDAKMHSQHILHQSHEVVAAAWLCGVRFALSFPDPIYETSTCTQPVAARSPCYYNQLDRLWHWQVFTKVLKPHPRPELAGGPESWSRRVRRCFVGG